MLLHKASSGASAASALLLGRRCFSSSSFSSRLQDELDSIRAAGTWKEERVIKGPQGVRVRVNRDQEVLNFCANNYLGLSSHPEVLKAGAAAFSTHGAGLSSVRFICGTQDIHKDLERKIARFHGQEDAILYASCFDANAGVFEQLLGPEDAVISDELNHASVIDGIRLCKAQRRRYKHKDMEDLEKHLVESQSCRARMIATDGVFSMDGNVAPLGDICHLAEKYDSLVFVDDCHATGFFGSGGRGTEAFFGMRPGSKVDLLNSTLGKAMGGAAGGYTAASKKVVDLLRQRSRPYLFSNSLPPSVVACASKVFDMLEADNSFVKNITQNTRKFRTEMTRAGFTITGDDHPICPVMLGDAKLASDFAGDMLAEGIYVIGFSYPVVPKGKARIRVQISAAHSAEDIDRTIQAFVKVGKKRGVLQ